MRRLGIDYDMPVLTPGKTIAIKRLWHPIIDAWSPIYRDMLEPFNFMKYTCPRLPIDMGLFDIEAARQCPNVLRVPIKEAGSDFLQLPAELDPLLDGIVRILQYDRWVTGEAWPDFWVHLTVHTITVPAGETQRFPGFHGDGLQGGKFKQKVVCEHSYIVTGPNPTVLAMQPFFVGHINEDRFNIFDEFGKQVREDSLYRLRAGHLYLIDPYVVHTSPICKEEMTRTFVRVTTTPSELLMPKNTRNPMLSGQNYPERIEVREFVSKPDVSIPLDFYGIEEM